MRLLCLCAFLLVPAVASAQSGGQAVVLAVGGIGGGLVLTNVAIVVPLPVVFPTGVALGVYGTSRMLGIDASLRNTLGDAVSGMVVGCAAGYAVYLLAGSPYSGDLGAALHIAAGAAAGSVAWSVADVRVDPAVLRTPAGERVAGLALRVAL